MGASDKLARSHCRGFGTELSSLMQRKMVIMTSPLIAAVTLALGALGSEAECSACDMDGDQLLYIFWKAVLFDVLYRYFPKSGYPIDTPNGIESP